MMSKWVNSPTRHSVLYPLVVGDDALFADVFPVFEAWFLEVGGGREE